MKIFSLLEEGNFDMLLTSFTLSIKLFLKNQVSIFLDSLKLIDVLIPTRGENESYLAEAISPFRFNIFLKNIILIVDNENDSVYESVKKNFGSMKKLQVYRSPGNGISRTLNFGISKCTAKLIARQDDDDISSYLRIYIQLFVLFITRSDLVFTNLQKIDVNGNRLSRFEYRRPTARVYPIGILLGCIVSHATVLGKKEIFTSNKFTNDILGEDYELWMRIIHKLKFINLSFKLYKFRIHGHQITNMKSPIEQHSQLYDNWVKLGTRVGLDQKILTKNIFLVPYTNQSNQKIIDSIEFKLFKSECVKLIDQLPKRVGNYYKLMLQELYI